MSANRFSTTVRTALAQAIITAAGATGAKLKLYNGTIPAAVGAVTGGNTLLASGQWASAPIGTATSGAIDFDESGFTQTSSGFTAGTPTFADITTSADAVVHRIELNVTDGWTFTGAVVTGQNLTLTSLSVTMPGAT
jgi:hypothetical protein